MLLFVNPNDYGKRDKLTLKVSFDDGMTWPKEHWIFSTNIAVPDIPALRP